MDFSKIDTYLGTIDIIVSSYLGISCLDEEKLQELNWAFKIDIISNKLTKLKLFHHLFNIAIGT
jgi:hypothetical protein